MTSLAHHHRTSAPRLSLAISLTVISFGLTACFSSSSGNGDDSNGGALEPTLASIQANIFTPICTACHIGSSAPEGLRLTQGQSHAHLVGVPSNQVDLLRVEAGNPEDSYLIHKLEGRQAVGARMPQGGPFLSQSEIAVIRQWIQDGALANVAGSTAAASVQLAWPPDGSHIHHPPDPLILQFDQEMDASLIHEASIQLIYRDTHSPDTTASVKATDLTLRISHLAPTTVLITRGEGQWTSGHYEIRVAGSGHWPVRTRAGEPIDGDGDGHPGGDYRTTFELSMEP
ncbi:hypothetical protein [Natronospira bacteriovora]|uniref:Cytochrome c domain-containing protein n=1 Tax=Natronospira bacteriovora TaxID=3069753 RepID=A0ABU0W8X1_9GAMM|nr:hypothetical protein [Natronospira sp. AB-CW4]MDQ2070475.1 hypothetical protein [Natronospira sp. AB-CW4]